VIPCVLHQTWRDTEVPAELARQAESWRCQHPGWAYRFWTDADLARFVAERFPEWREAFEQYPAAIMRVDLARYLILKAEGGVYADLDTEALAPLDRLLSSDRPIFGAEPPSHAALEFARARGFERVVGNAVIASPPAHGFWDHLLALLQRCRRAPNPLDATGPFVLTAAIESAPEQLGPTVLPAHVFSPFDKDGAPTPCPAGVSDEPLVHHGWAGTWWRAQAGAAPPAADPNAEPPLPRPSWREGLRRIRRRLLARQAPPAGSVLIAVPVRNAADALDRLFGALAALDYPPGKLSLAFLEGDSVDDSFARLQRFAREHGERYRRIAVLKRDYGAPRYEERWQPEHQRARRGHIARVRNRLLRRALGDEDWVLWIDADIVAFAPDILSRLLDESARIVQPNCVLAPGGPSFDTNAWIAERALPPREIWRHVVGGLYQPPRHHHRLYLSDLRYRERVALDSVGGTMLLVDANLHRAGLVFPTAPDRALIETEAFAARARAHGIVPIGLPNVEIMHANR
jgi:hypothetical protein